MMDHLRCMDQPRETLNVTSSTFDLQRAHAWVPDRYFDIMEHTMWGCIAYEQITIQIFNVRCYKQNDHLEWEGVLKALME